MKTLITILSTALVALFGAVPVQDARPATQEAQLADLSWLSGAWRGSDGQSTWESLYSSPDGGQIVGASKEMKGGRTVMIDFEHFYVREGKMRMNPYPFGKRSVEFTLTDFSGARQEAVFENPDHDFPQKFTYRRAGDDQLLIELVGEMGGSPLTATLDLARQDG